MVRLNINSKVHEVDDDHDTRLLWMIRAQLI
jgi:aerobic-type carbon monoxide dehydrogenase small subunit (CoxS/CutS family)